MSWEAANIKRTSRQEGEDRDVFENGDEYDATGTKNGNHHAGQVEGGRRSFKKRRKTKETVEAVLARLSKSYSIAIECVGALHNANAAIMAKERKRKDKNDREHNDNEHDTENKDNKDVKEDKDDNNNNEKNDSSSNDFIKGENKNENENDGVHSLQKVAEAARITFEKAVLLDPLILVHCPTLHRVMQNLASEEAEESSDTIVDHGRDPNIVASNRGSNHRWLMVRQPRPSPPVLSSKAHKATIRQLAYLSLVNYSDLLISCARGNHNKTDDLCSKNQSDHHTNSSSSGVGNHNKTILDTGVVRRLQTFLQNSFRCWIDEKEDVTQRLAIAALCDASRLDGSDPSVWLKLACAARRLGQIEEDKQQQQQQQKHEPTRKTTRRYQKLISYALESGYTALPPTVPPNRTIVHVLKEFNKEKDRVEEFYTPKLQEETDSVEIYLDLTRYSWSALGRMLMKACREGSAYNDNIIRQQLRKPQQPSTKKSILNFGSPIISLRLSPMLILPSNALAIICQFLENESIWNLEATCRALSVSIISARVVMEKQQKNAKATTSIADTTTTTATNISDADEIMKDVISDMKNNDVTTSKTETATTKTQQHVKVEDDDSVSSGKMCERMEPTTETSSTTPASIYSNRIISTYESPSKGEKNSENDTEKMKQEESDDDKKKQEETDHDKKYQEENNNDKKNKEVNDDDKKKQDENDDSKKKEQEKYDHKKKQEETTMTSTNTNATTSTVTQTHRTSKRLRSQLITSGKIAERNARRKSVEYCLFAATLSCTTSDDIYKKAFQKKIEWESFFFMSIGGLKQLQQQKQQQQQVLHSSTTPGTAAAATAVIHIRNEALKRLGDSSLSSFLERFNMKNSGPTDLLFKYLSHISLNVEDVFSVDPGDTMVLTSCAIECFEIVDRNDDLQRSLTPGMLGPLLDKQKQQQSSTLSAKNKYRQLHLIKLFAIDLLHAELRFKRCERNSHLNEITLDCDENFVSCIVPTLLSAITEMEKSNHSLVGDSDGDFDCVSPTSSIKTSVVEWTKLKARCFWLAAGFFLWRGRIAQDVSEAREAELEGIKYIGVTIECLSLPPSVDGVESESEESKHKQQGQKQKPIGLVWTPHLESPGRTEIHWKKLSVDVLIAFRDEIQASSIVSLARQQFLEKIAEISTRKDKLLVAQTQREVADAIEIDTETENDKEEEENNKGMMLSNGEMSSLSDIGEALFVRYDVSYDGSGQRRHCELIDDFLSVHGNEILSKPLIVTGKADRTPWEKLEILLPTGIVDVDHLLELSNFASILTILTTCLQLKPENNLRVILLIARLLLATRDLHDKLLQSTNNKGLGSKDRSNQPSGSSSVDNFSDSDNDDDDNDDNSSLRQGAGDKISSKNNDWKAWQYGRFIKYLANKLCDVFLKVASEETKQQFMYSQECLEVIHVCLDFSSEWFRSFANSATSPQNTELLDLDVFRSIQTFVSLLCRVSLKSDEKIKDNSRIEAIKKLYINELMKLFVSQRPIINSLVRVRGHARISRAVRQRKCIGRAELVGAICCELGSIFSVHLCSIDGSSKIRRSNLLEIDLNEENEEVGCLYAETPCNKLVVFCDSLLWFWNYICTISRADASGTGGNSFDRPIYEKLRIPVATVLCGFCGSAACTRLLSKSHKDNRGQKDVDNNRKYRDDACKTNDRLCLTEFLDTDASANDLLSDSEDDAAVDSGAQRGLSRELLRTICHTVHCIGLVFGDIDENEAVSVYLTENGPLLPLVTTRVLNHFSDMILLNFGSEEDGKDARSLWSDVYPITTRRIGYLLDSLLYKAYKCLHGFTLVGPGDHITAKEPGPVATKTTSDLMASSFRPETTHAAAQLYRCITRAYSNARKSPPKAALECVSSALPPIKETAKSTAIRRFLFTSEVYFEIDDVLSLVTKGAEWDPHLPKHSGWEWVNEIQVTGTGESKSDDDDFVVIVQKGICAQLAQGPPPTVQCEAGADEEERVFVTRSEEELSKKFNVILDNLCYCDSDCEEWYRAAQCLILKAELIADRLGMQKGFSRSHGFSVPEHRSLRDPKLDTVELLDVQDQEERLRRDNWLPYLGNDLSLYVRHNWSSFSSLQACAKELEQSMSNDTSADDNDDHIFQKHAQKEVDAFFEKEDFVEWQQAWGGVFVSALRKMAVRCMCCAMFLLHRRDTTGLAEKSLMSEIVESLGTAFYTFLMGSQNYGYPMHVMSTKQKRDLAEASRVCFQHAVKKVEDKEDQTWDLLFMIGKCHEKIARTYQREKFSAWKVEEENNCVRRYEHHMHQSFENYATALAQAKDVEKTGGIVDEAGGSSHGTTELLYRLHASRLKCLLLAVNEGEENREMAEAEALRLTELYWYGSTPDTQNSGIRDRVWNVLVDLVDALAQCRLEQPFFHRSVYRHAQALIWAPVLSDPVAGRREGSAITVPGNRSYRLRGFNSSTTAAGSSLPVISCLFERKRAQLCAVWVTTTGLNSPFQVINSSVRKYDSLRGKYFYAYTDNLRLCHRKTEIETLFRWIAASKRDLPSIFQESALVKGGPPDKSHNGDCLLMKCRSLGSSNFLKSVKRQANSALADILLHDLSTCSTSDSKAIEISLKSAYACFLRLNCSVHDLKKTWAYRYGHKICEVDAVCQAYLKLSESKVVNIVGNDWSGGGKSDVLDSALRRCKELFPSLSGNFYSKKAMKKNSGRGKVDVADTPRRLSLGQFSGKRKILEVDNNDPGKVSFEVAVPEGLGAGDTFVTTVKVRGNLKKVKLTVPPGHASSLRFSLSVPAGGDSETKRARL